MLARENIGIHEGVINWNKSSTFCMIIAAAIVTKEEHGFTEENTKIIVISKMYIY